MDNLINRWKLNNEQPILSELSCYICKFNDKIEKYKIYKANDIFYAGELIRYQCPNCECIFGDLRFLHMDKSEISNDYKDLYSFYSEGDTSNFILESLNKINLGKDKSYLDFACGKDNRTLDLLNENGYDVYGYDLYTNMDHPKCIKNTFKFDIVYTNNYIEHLIDPFNDLKKVIDLLKDDGKLVIISPCCEYCIEFTNYHTFYFLGKSVKYLCNELSINEIYSEKIFFTDSNEWSIIKIFEKKWEIEPRKVVFMEQITELLKKYNIEPSFNYTYVPDAYGIGDVLFRLLCISQNLNNFFYINLDIFLDTIIYNYPISHLEFRIQLVNDIIKYNNIDR